jgi:hypothetical protein
VDVQHEHISLVVRDHVQTGGARFGDTHHRNTVRFVE